MKKAPAITLHKNELDGVGIDLCLIEEFAGYLQSAHRDDHYMFILQQKGSLLMEIDFSEVKLKGASLCFVAPGQVHRYIKQQHNTGWAIFAEVSWVPEQYRVLFNTYQHVRQTVAVHTNDLIFTSIPILEQLLRREQHSLHKAVLLHQVGVILGMIASAIQQSHTAAHAVNGQRYQLVNQFKQLTRDNYKELKQVQQYAGLLNITPLYLNEVVKAVTGFPASYWIQQEIILEAKRLLYYTTLDVKQVAYELGYEDHTYFSRFFKKNTGTTAQKFRTRNHDLSNHTR